MLSKLNFCLLSFDSSGYYSCASFRMELVMTDMVNSPPHYLGHPKGIECIEVIEDNPYFNLSQTMKYVWRVSWGSKFNDLEDLEKSRWYLQREINRRKELQEEKVNDDPTQISD